jgi:uncharacterized protein (DUF1697 family)
MTRHIILLRGINIGRSNRIAMPALRELLTSAGFEDVRTYLQSGNVVAGRDAGAEDVARECEEAIREHFGLEIPIVTRTGDEIAAVIEHNPLGAVAENPKLHQVTFLDGELADESAEQLAALAVEPERLVVHGRELYSWYPNGIARSKLANGTVARKLGVNATSRNWTTVLALGTLVDAD